MSYYRQTLLQLRRVSTLEGLRGDVQLEKRSTSSSKSWKPKTLLQSTPPPSFQLTGLITSGLISEISP
jgi:hypothetical protein